MPLPDSARHRLRRLGSNRFFRRFRRGTDAEFLPGNALTLLRTGGDFFAELFAAIERAEHCVFLEFYIVKADATGRRLAELLAAAAARGVEVCLLYDYIGSFDTPASYFRALVAQGVRCHPFNPPPFRGSIFWFDKRDHRKLAIIDCCVAYTGGINIGDEYAGGTGKLYWRDLGLKVEGGAVGELRRLFCESWQAATAALPLSSYAIDCGNQPGDDEVAIVSGGPHHNRSRIRAAFRMAIAAATASIRIETPYFVPGPRFIRALLRAARRGVRVQLILPAQSDVPLVRLVNRSSYATLIKGGIEIFELGGTILHGKVMLIDDSWSVIGSANLDQRSFHRNYEINVIASSPAFGQQVAEMFADDLAASRPITLDEHESRGFGVRLLERLIAPLNWFL